MIFVFWSWVPFGFHFGGVLGVQMEAKAFKKALQKNIKKMMPQMSPNWSQRDTQIASPGHPPVPQTAHTAWKPTRRSPEGLTCRNVAQDMQITPKLPPNMHNNYTNQNKIGLRYYLVFWTWFSLQQLQSGIRE